MIILTTTQDICNIPIQVSTPFNKIPQDFYKQKSTKEYTYQLVFFQA